MTPQRHTSVVEFPNDLAVVITRSFDAPIQLVFDVLTKPEHVRQTFAPFDEEVTVCEIDLRVGGDYHYVMVTRDGVECSFRGTYLEIDPPTRTVQTWLFDGWPDAPATETVELHEADGVTTVRISTVFADKAGRAHMTKYDGMEASMESIAAYLQTLLQEGSTNRVS